ncbi:PIN domain-like protein [Dichotomocladium elegans]|nr:PIN domain-like protein [Dichotomocladium elegans]
MPIRHFEIYTAERRLLQTSGVPLLKDTRLGIEGSYWLRKILGKDSAVTAMGGLPLKLKEVVENEIKAFKANHIQPIFVFPGLAILRKDKPFSHEDKRPSLRATGWELYDKNRIESALQSWGSGGGFHPADLLNQVFHILHENGIEFIRAPYSAWAQLAYLYTHPKQIINAVYGGTELLMFDVDKIITAIDFEKGNYMWMSKKTVLQDLHVNDEQFLDICLLAGFEYCSSFPPLNNNMNISFTFKDVHELVKHHKTGFNTVQFYIEDPGVSKSNYIDMFCRARCVIRYHPIITDEGEVRPLNADFAPNDIHELIGYRLSDELYYYLMRGLIGPQV